MINPWGAPVGSGTGAPEPPPSDPGERRLNFFGGLIVGSLVGTLILGPILRDYAKKRGFD
jgi:hypothetical protein